jgi:hypothetical protein
MNIPLLQRIAAFIKAHGMTVRYISNDGVLAASPGQTQEGYLFSDLSPAISNFTEARNWLGY